MSWTKAEQHIVEGIERNVTELVNLIKGDDRPGKPGMAENLRNVQQDTLSIRAELKETNRNNVRTHKRLWHVLAGIGLVAVAALLLHWTAAGQLVINLMQLALRWIT